MRRSLSPHRPLLLVILLVAFALRIFLLDGQSLWWDELKTVERATVPLPEMMADLVGKRNHMPLYFLLMRVWVLLGQSTFVLRFFSVVWGVLSVAEIYRLGRMVAGQAVGVVAALLLAVAPFHVWYSQEARMYTMLPFVLLVAHDFLLQGLWQGHKRFWVGYGAAMLMALYLHYFAIFVLLAHYVFFALHFRKMRAAALRWFVTATAVGALVAPWVLVVATTSGYGASAPGWISPIYWYDPLLTIWSFSAGFTLPVGNYAGYGLWFLYVLGFLASLRFIGSKTPEAAQPTSGQLLFFWFLLPLSITYVISLNWGIDQLATFSIYMDRYLIIILPAFLLLVSWGLVTLTRNRRRWLPVLAGIIILGTGMSMASMYNNPAYSRENWRDALDFITKNRSLYGSIIGRGDLQTPLRYYDIGLPYLELPPAENELIITAAFDEVMTARLQILHAEDIQQAWLIEVYYNQNPHNFPGERNERTFNQKSATRQWLDARLTAAGHKVFPGIRLTLYNLQEK